MKLRVIEITKLPSYETSYRVQRKILGLFWVSCFKDRKPYSEILEFNTSPKASTAMWEYIEERKRRKKKQIRVIETYH